MLSDFHSVFETKGMKLLKSHQPSWESNILRIIFCYEYNQVPRGY